MEDCDIVRGRFGGLPFLTATSSASIVDFRRSKPRVPSKETLAAAWWGEEVLSRDARRKYVTTRDADTGLSMFPSGESGCTAITFGLVALLAGNRSCCKKAMVESENARLTWPRRAECHSVHRTSMQQRLMKGSINLPTALIKPSLTQH